MVHGSYTHKASLVEGVVVTQLHQSKIGDNGPPPKNQDAQGKSDEVTYERPPIRLGSHPEISGTNVIINKEIIAAII